MPLNLTGPTKLYKHFIQRSPIQVFPLVGTNQYHFLDSKAIFPPIAYDIENPPPDSAIPQNQTHIKNLAKRTFLLINGGQNVALDDRFLSEKKDVLLNLAADCVGTACYDLVRLARIQSNKLSSADQMIKTLERLSTDTDDVGVMLKPSLLHQLKDGILKGRISHFITGKLKTKNVIDYTYPMFTPLVSHEEIIIFNILDSFIIADPISFFLTEHNQIAVEFKIDIQNKEAIQIFNLSN